MKKINWDEFKNDLKQLTWADAKFFGSIILMIPILYFSAPRPKSDNLYYDRKTRQFKWRTPPKPGQFHVPYAEKEADENE